MDSHEQHLVSEALGLCQENEARAVFGTLFSSALHSALEGSHVPAVPAALDYKQGCLCASCPVPSAEAYILSLCSLFGSKLSSYLEPCLYHPHAGRRPCSYSCRLPPADLALNCEGKSPSLQALSQRTEEVLLRQGLNREKQLQAGLFNIFSSVHSVMRVAGEVDVLF